jgi:hypothetical protein
VIWPRFRADFDWFCAHFWVNKSLSMMWSGYILSTLQSGYSILIDLGRVEYFWQQVTYTMAKPETRNTRPPVSNPIMWQFGKQNVPPKLFFLSLFREFVSFFQLSHRGPNQRQETLDLPYLTLLCDNLENRMFLQNFFSCPYFGNLLVFSSYPTEGCHARVK